MSGFDWFLIAWFLFGAVALVAQVGKPRKPVESPSAALAVLITVGFIAGLLFSRGVL